MAQDGSVVEFEVPTPDASVRGIAVTPDGDIWFTENFANKIGRFDAAGGLVGEYAIPTPKSGARCIVAMADGRLFFTQYDAGLIGEIVYTPL
jgi:virginiamycin B lyase